jgi:hypothetical protein
LIEFAENHGLTFADTLQTFFVRLD